MPEISGIKQSLVQAQALERVQESARRQGEQQQQTFAVSLNRQVDAKGHQVNEGERATEEELDPNAKQKKEEGRPGAHPPLPDEDSGAGEDDEDLGRHIDARA